MTTFFTKIASAVTALALVASFVPTTVFAAGTITPEEFVTVDGSFKGISVGFRASGLNNVTAVSVALTRADGSVVTKTANGGVLGIINAPGDQQLTAPFVILEGSFKEADDTLYWNVAPATWNADTRPVSVTITATTADGDVATTNSTFNDGGSWPTYASLIPTVNAENFNTHSGADYKGINVGFNVANFSSLDEVLVTLKDVDGNTIVENEGVKSMLNPLLSNGAAQLSTPFITQNLTYGEEAYWTLGEWNSYAKPVKAVISVNGVVTENVSLSEQHVWETIIPTVNAENFNTEDNAGYKGINVGFNVANFTEFEEVTVELQNADGDTLVENTGVLAMLNTLLVGGVAQLSTPFITQDLGYAATEEYWVFGEWASADKPAKAIITVNGVVAENLSLSEQQVWETIAPVIAVEEEEESRSSGSSRGGQSRRVTTTAPAGQVLGASTGPTTGQVLGASTYNFTVDLSYGSTGADVNALQQMLIDAGLLAIDAPTGWFGPMTRAALAKWQAAHGVAPAVGYFGPITRAAIVAMNAPATTTSTTTSTTTAE